MTPEQLLKRIEATITTLLAREPDFTGSIELKVNFLKGVPGDIVKEKERSRERLTS